MFEAFCLTAVVRFTHTFKTRPDARTPLLRVYGEDTMAFRTDSYVRREYAKMPM